MNMRYGMIMLIEQEVMLLVEWLWELLDERILKKEVNKVEREELKGGVWKKKGIEVIDKMNMKI